MHSIAGSRASQRDHVRSACSHCARFLVVAMRLPPNHAYFLHSVAAFAVRLMGPIQSVWPFALFNEWHCMQNFSMLSLPLMLDDHAVHNQLHTIIHSLASAGKVAHTA
eukprot:6184545-Pleurochrysis_carterae.AAC.3